MTDQQANGAQENSQAQPLPLTIHAQYIKDFSFENPNAPHSLKPGQKQPEMVVNVTMDANRVEEATTQNMYEVILHIRAEANRDDKAVFLVELQYAVVCSLNDIPEKHHHPILMIEAPKLAFPFARQLVANVTMDAGYPPLMLNPVDFEALYIQQFKLQGGEEGQAANA